MKRFFSCTLLLILLFTCFSTALATSVETKSSTTLSLYSAKLNAGSTSGNIKLFYDVTSNGISSRLGISTIKIYNSTGNYVTTIYGTTKNGLISADVSQKLGTYTYSGTSKTSYYAVVTFTATINGVTDTKSFTTNTMKAP